MRYMQHKGGQKLHIVYELGDAGFTQPVCGKKMNGYRMTINVPLGNACKNCLRRINSRTFDPDQFIRSHFQE